MRLFVLLLVVHTAAASVTSPTDGYIHPGRYTPVIVDGPTTLSGNDLLTTVTSTRGVVPVMVTGPATDLQWTGGSLPLKPLTADERLVAATVPIPSRLFEHEHVITVELDPTDPLPGPAAAWTGLDAAVFDRPSWGRVPPATRDALLSAGVTVVVDGQPVAAPPPTSIDLISLDAYSPVRFHDRDVSSPVRRTVLTILLLSSATVIGLSVYVRRTWPIVLVSTAVVGGLFRYHVGNGDQSRFTGDVYVIDGVVRRDQFVYDWSRDDRRRSVPWSGDTRPIFSSSAAMAAADFRIVVDDVGTAFEFRAPEGSTQCFVHRTIETPVDWTPGAGPSPMSDVVKQLYESPTLEVAGRAPSSAIVLRRRS